MVARIEDYAMIGDRETAALISRDGSVDWLCLPRFDSPACFAAMLGTPENGRWLLCPAGDIRSTKRRYREGTLVLETEYETETGTAVVVDCMPARDTAPRLIRMVEGRRGHVAMKLELVLRFDYGAVVPWVQRTNGGILAIAGPDAVHVHSDVELRGENFRTLASFDVAAKERVSFALGWSPSFGQARAVGHVAKVDAMGAIAETTRWWKRWSAKATYDGPHREAVVRSLITLKALTYAPTGAIVAAPTTSLPECWGGSRNWDYRYCWLRDATFTLYALLDSGYTAEASAWRDWLLRAFAGRPDQSKVMYGVRGERRIEEVEIPWLEGFHGSKPVRVGNAVHQQLQLDVYGEVSAALFASREAGLDENEAVWALQTKVIEFLEGAWRSPDEGIWEVRGPRREFTHSKVMAWVAFDRAVKMVERFRLEGPLERWRSVRDDIHREVCGKGYDAALGSFVQYYGAREADASTLLIPMVGFLPVRDPRVAGTVRLIERTLMDDGLVRRYATKSEIDGLPPGEGCFLPCSFWLANAYVLMGRRAEAIALFERLVGLCNDVGLLAEEYDPGQRRFAGNFPQALSHVSLVNTARRLHESNGPAKRRRRRAP